MPYLRALTDLHARQLDVWSAARPEDRLGEMLAKSRRQELLGLDAGAKAGLDAEPLRKRALEVIRVYAFTCKVCSFTGLGHGYKVDVVVLRREGHGCKYFPLPPCNLGALTALSDSRLGELPFQKTEQLPRGNDALMYTPLAQIAQDDEGLISANNICVVPD